MQIRLGTDSGFMDATRVVLDLHVIGHDRTNPTIPPLIYVRWPYWRATCGIESMMLWIKAVEYFNETYCPG